MQTKILSGLRSIQFFWASMIVFVLNASWIALSGRYPMAHDENFHLGLIQLYSTRLSPFWTANPAGDATFGAVARDPSYLYHYLLSFPYRLLQQAVTTETAQVIVLRFVSVALVAWGIWLFRRVLRQHFSAAVTNITICLLVLTPMVPFFAAQLNYDPVVFLATAGAIYTAQQLLNKLKGTKKLDGPLLLKLAILCMLGSLVKYAFLPIAGAIVMTLGWQLYRIHVPLKTYWQQLVASVQKLQKPLRYTLIALTILSAGLFAERYVINTVRYGTPTPECNQVLSIDACMAYSPWRRNYLTQQSYEQGTLVTKYPSYNFFNYLINIWGVKTTSQLFFAIDGAASNYQAAKPYRIPRITSLTILGVGLALLLWQVGHRKMIRTYRIGMFMGVISLYLGALLAQNYLDFLHIGFPYAIQGRYFLPILPLAYGILAQVYATALRKHTTLKVYVAVAVIMVFLTQAGGAGVYITRSNPGWWWPNNTVVLVNQNAQNVLRFFIIGH